ncbi:MAG: hypothetical protein JO090_13695, partial [Rhizobacter sp.]|nr:hypothetical protein [Rhizobacter sp.]
MRGGDAASAARIGELAAAADPPADAIERAVDRDGHVREAAVRELGSAPRGDAIRALLVRANDWVPQVRAAAAEALAVHLREEFVPAWALALDAVEALRRAGRVDAAAVLAPIDAFLATPPRLERIDAATRNAPAALRRLVGTLRRNAASDDEALATLLRDDAAGADIVAALSALQAADTLGATELRDAVWQAAIASPHAAVRRFGLARVLDAHTGERATLVGRFAFDPSVAVRARVLAASSEAERAAIRAAATRLLDAPTTDAAGDTRRAIALHTLVALRPFDWSPASPWLRTPGERTRAVAFAACWLRADAAARETLLLAAFGDAAPRLQRWAASAVRRDGLVPPWRALLHLVVQAPAPSRVRAVRRALGCASPWWRLAFELGLGEATGAVDASGLAAWCFAADRSYVAPGAADATAIA